jgi:hypothetical protein
MRQLVASIAIASLCGLTLGFTSGLAVIPDAPVGVEIGQAEFGDLWPFVFKEGHLRCEGAGTIILSAAGKDYAVNGMASTHYASIQPIYKRQAGSVVDVGPIISRGLTLCRW